jgi:sulfoxide reductase catalytic subunit YedY
MAGRELSRLILPSEITPESVYLNRRQLLRGGVALGAGLLLPPAGAAVALPYQAVAERPDAPGWLQQKIRQRRLALNNPTGEPLTPYASVSGYNNFYEFGTGKADPAAEAHRLRPEPWTLTVDGLCDGGGRYALEDFLQPHALQDRIYRFRCVEAWSMVVPWLGVPLAELIRRFKPRAEARFVQFTTLHDPEQMPEQRSNSLDWPYVEALRLDEALHPLTLLAVGVYGRSLPAQNGAPLRLVVPWKYGFKSIKSIVRISFVARAPVTTWLGMAPQEYGFYANVNPAVDHPRWSQARERRLPNSLFDPNWKDTLPFNGYARDVAALYRGMDLKRFY